MAARERNSIAYNPHPSKPSQDSSPKLSSETLDHTSLLVHHHPKSNHDFNLHQPQTQSPIMGQSPDPSPADQPASATPTLPQQPPPIDHTATTVRYRECLRNHGARMGAHVLDGCGEFMPSGDEGTPEALKCAACECHRSFHRREVEGESQPVVSTYYTHNHPGNSTRRTIIHPTQAPQLPPAHQQHNYHQGLATSPMRRPMHPILMTFGRTCGAPAESSSEDLNMFGPNARENMNMGQTSKKRYRTKFTQQQKERMQEFAEKLGWRIQKQDEEEVMEFCNGVGVKRQVFKVWMHNNKQLMKKKH